jgi:hypothetical protein
LDLLMKNILITGVGGPTPRSFAIALRNFSRYARYHLVATDCDRYALGLYQQHLFDSAYVIPRASASGYWGAVEEIIDKERIDHAVVLPEVEVLEWAKRAGEVGLPCSALIPDLNIVRQLVDKATMSELLEPAGLVPKSFTVLRDEPLETRQLPLPFPFWIRSASGSSGLGSLKIDSADNLRNWLAINPGVEKFLASEYLPGRNLCCKMLYFEGSLVRSAVGERVNYIMAKVAPSGITGNTSFGRLLNDPKVFDVANRAMNVLFQATGARKHGFFTVDLKEDERWVPKVTEVNVRHVAFTQCFAAGGANFAEDTIRLLDHDPDFDKNFRMYQFEPDLVFLRDVDCLPILMREGQLL